MCAYLLERPGEVWAAWRALFFLIKKELVVATNDVSSNPFVSAETLKACALQVMPGPVVVNLLSRRHAEARLS